MPRYCDIVMKGGITSGVVYPPAVVELAKTFSFRNIGGTSAGAIAAAMTAAAEYGRQHNVDGFARLATLPADLGNPVSPGGDSLLLSLFQPRKQALQIHQNTFGCNSEFHCPGVAWRHSRIGVHLPRHLLRRRLLPLGECPRRRDPDHSRGRHSGRAWRLPQGDEGNPRKSLRIVPGLY